MLDANVAIINLPVCLAKISPNAVSTLNSLFENPSTIAFVLSLINNLTPFLPISAILWMFDIGPIGVKSNLKSPVLTITPFGVVIAIPIESGIEWVVLKNSTSKCFVLTFIFSLIILRLS